MPRYLPRPDLPPILYEALVEQSYQNELKKYFESLDDETKKLKKFSATTLSRSPRERILSERHDHEIVEDPIMGRYWSFLGGLTHLLLERNARPEDLVEKRLGWNVGPFPDGSYMHLHAQADSLSGSDNALYSPSGELLAYTPKHTLQDWKLTSAWSLVKGEKMAFHSQLNINRWIVEKHGYKANLLRNIFLFKDWRKADADKIANYPKDKIVSVEIPIWDKDKTEKYFMDRMWLHASSESLMDDDLPLCTPEERWMGLPEWKVYKFKDNGERMRNSKFTSNSRLEAEEWLEETRAKEMAKVRAENLKKKKPKPLPEYQLKEVPAKPEKCFMCSARPWCSQWSEDIAKGYVKNEPEPENEEEN